MLTQTEENAVLQKTRELCQVLLDDPSLNSARQCVASFMEDENARAQYDGLVALRQELQRKQQSGQPLAQEEISSFEAARDELMGNPVAKGFIDAQEQMHEVHHTVNDYVSKTFELGRVPTAEDFQEGCCGNEGCGCSH